MTTDKQVPELIEELEINDIAALRRIANPIRLRILFHLRQPMSIRELAEAMGTPVTRLYYHIGILFESGVILVTQTRKRGAQLEKVYRIVAQSIRPSSDILKDGTVTPVEFAEVAATLVLDSARAELTTSLALHAESGFSPDSINGSLGRAIVSVSTERATEVAQILIDLVTDLKEDDERNGTLYGLTYSFFPIEPPKEEPSA